MGKTLTDLTESINPTDSTFHGEVIPPNTSDAIDKPKKDNTNKKDTNQVGYTTTQKVLLTLGNGGIVLHII